MYQRHPLWLHCIILQFCHCQSAIVVLSATTMPQKVTLRLKTHVLFRYLVFLEFLPKIYDLSFEKICRDDFYLALHTQLVAFPFSFQKHRHTICPYKTEQHRSTLKILQVQDYNIREPRYFLGVTFKKLWFLDKGSHSLSFEMYQCLSPYRSNLHVRPPSRMS